MNISRFFISQERNSGITLLEVLVVMAVLGLIAALGYPMVKRTKSQAQSALCATKLRQLGVAMNSYLGDHGMRFPTMAAAREDKSEEIPVMDTVLVDYVNDGFAFACPGDHAGHYQKTGSSYFWNSLVNGQVLGNMDLLGLTKKEIGIPLISDKENYHKNVGDEVNILYADGHVAKQLQFVVDPQ